MSVRIMQGDSYPIPVELVQNDTPLTPDLVSDIEICIGENITRRLSSGEIWFQPDENMWYFRMSQEETLSLDPESYEVIARVKYPTNPADVVGVSCGTVLVIDTHSEEVL